MNSSSKADRYRENVDRLVQGGSRGTIVMVAIFVLSAILSALFFWRHSQGVFSGIPWIFATVLGLLVGLVPSELAFFAWKDILKKRAEEMTAAQLSAASAGMWLGIIFSVMNIAGLFLTSFPGVPDAIQQIAPWLAFTALFLPIPTQLYLFARYSTNEKTVVEARQKASLNAAAHSAAIKAEKARVGAVLEGIETELETALDPYGAETGRENAQTALTSGVRNIMDGFYNRLHGGGQSHPRTVPSDHPQLAALGVAKLSDEDVARIAAAMAAMSNPTHNAPRHDPEVYPLAQPAAGQGERPRPNGPSGATYGPENFR